MIPLVKVIETGSLVWEGSCGSGSVACAVAQSEAMENGGFSCEYRQPAGTVRASVERQGGNVIAASIGGEVTLDEPMAHHAVTRQSEMKAGRWQLSLFSF